MGTGRKKGALTILWKLGSCLQNDCWSHHRHGLQDTHRHHDGFSVRGLVRGSFPCCLSAGQKEQKDRICKETLLSKAIFL